MHSTFSFIVKQIIFFTQAMGIYKQLAVADKPQITAAKTDPSPSQAEN